MNGWEAKAKVETTRKYNVMYRLEHVPKGKMKIQAKGKLGKRVIFIVLNLQPEATQ